MNDKELISGFMECCLSGASKTQVIREYKKSFNLNDEDINFLLDSCSFRKKPKIVNYLDFYKNELTKKCEKITNNICKTRGSYYFLLKFLVPAI